MAEPGERMEKIKAYFQAHFRKPQMPKYVKSWVVGHERRAALRCIAKAKDCMERMETVVPKKTPPKIKTHTHTTSLKIGDEKAAESKAEAAKNETENEMLVLCESPMLGFSLLRDNIMTIKPGSETFGDNMTRVGEAMGLARKKCAETFNAANAEMVESLGLARSDIGYYDGLPLKSHSRENWKTGVIWGGYLSGAVLMSLMIEMVRLASIAPGTEPLPQSERIAEMLASLGIAVASGAIATISVKLSRDGLLRRKWSQRRVEERNQANVMKTGQRALRLLEGIEKHIERIRQVSNIDAKKETDGEPAEGAADGSKSH
jgi:hypothetical protein